MVKFLQLLRFMRSIAVHIPEGRGQRLDLIARVGGGRGM
jgi:hypothetical protein